MNTSVTQTAIARLASKHGVGVTDTLVDFARTADPPITFVAVCPNSEAVARAALSVSARLSFPLFFAATLNQIDTRDGYTSWTPGTFANWVELECTRLESPTFVVIGLDHGGPWKKDLDYLKKLGREEAIAAAQSSIRACLSAGYSLLHIDTTDDPHLAAGVVPVDLIVERTVSLVKYAEGVRNDLSLPAVSYEVGTEEVSGGLTSVARFEEFVQKLKSSLEQAGLDNCWPCFFVGDVGTDLNTTTFDLDVARSLGQLVLPHGSMLKGHYTDFVDNPESYPVAGMGGANIGPEFSYVEFEAVMELAEIESLLDPGPARLSGIVDSLSRAVIETGRWRKWLTPTELDMPFDSLPAERKRWLMGTGSRYVWAKQSVRDARALLYNNISPTTDGPRFVQDQIEESIRRYAVAFGLEGLNDRLIDWACS